MCLPEALAVLNVVIFFKSKEASQCVIARTIIGYLQAAFSITVRFTTSYWKCILYIRTLELSFLQQSIGNYKFFRFAITVQIFVCFDYLWQLFLICAFFNITFGTIPYYVYARCNFTGLISSTYYKYVSLIYLLSYVIYSLSSPLSYLVCVTMIAFEYYYLRNTKSNVFSSF